jgi:hypothetical protein
LPGSTCGARQTLAALLQARDEELEARREAIKAEGHDPAIALELWLEAIDEWLSAFKGMPEPLRTALSDQASPLAITARDSSRTPTSSLSRLSAMAERSPGCGDATSFLGALATSWARGAVMADDASAESLKELLRRGWATPD